MAALLSSGSVIPFNLVSSANLARMTPNFLIKFLAGQVTGWAPVAAIQVEYQALVVTTKQITKPIISI